MSSDDVQIEEVSSPQLMAGGSQDVPSQVDLLHRPPQRVVKIPCKVMLDLVLSELSHPREKYDLHMSSCGHISATVTFYVSARVPGNLLQAVKMGGVEDLDSEIAEETAAKEAIRFIETWENIEIEDLHYSELRYLQEIKKDLHSKIVAATNEKGSLQRGLSLAASRMVAFSNQLYSIT